MPPTLRSNLRTPSSADSSASSSTVTTPRKTRLCSKCKTPRAGHPRQGCPYASSPLSREATNDSPPDNESEHIADVMESMHIKTNSREDKQMTHRRRSSANMLIPDASLASLSTNSSEVVARLIVSGIMDDNASFGEEEERCRRDVSEWQAKLDQPTEIKEESRIINLSRQTMPGTLHTPSPSFFEQSQDSHRKFETDPFDDNATRTQTPFAVGAFMPDGFSQPRRLARTDSAVERDAFLAELDQTSKSPPATVYILPMSELPVVQKSAAKLGFYSRVFNPVTCHSCDARSQDGWLILGRDPQAVQILYDEMEAKKAAGNQNEQRGSRLRAAAGGAVVGAVATFTGLAFS